MKMKHLSKSSGGRESLGFSQRVTNVSLANRGHRSLFCSLRVGPSWSRQLLVAPFSKGNHQEPVFPSLCVSVYQSAHLRPLRGLFIMKILHHSIPKEWRKKLSHVVDIKVQCPLSASVIAS